jgi:hypothetical protein
MLIMQRLIAVYDFCMILFVPFCMVLCSHMLTLQMPLSFFYIVAKVEL